MTCVVSQGDVSVTILQFPTLAKFREGIAKKDKFKDFCTKNPDFRVDGACDGNTLAEVDEEEVYAYIIKNKNPCFTLVLGASFSFCLHTTHTISQSRPALLRRNPVVRVPRL